VRSIGITEAKRRLSELVDQAAAGETICITRRGRPVAQLVAVTKPRKPVDVAALRALTDRMTSQTESAGEFMRRLRDDYRY